MNHTNACKRAIWALGAGTVILALSACSTVDLTQVSVQKSEQTSLVPRLSVVEKATSRLSRIFHKKKWCAEGEMTTTQASNILLHGLKKDGVVRNGYKPASLKVLHADLDEAARHIHQTTRAAQVYLEMSTNADDLEKELNVLEQALRISRQAEARFSNALIGFGVEKDEVSQAYVREMNGLQSVTDIYGDRIRAAHTAKVLRQGA